VLLIERGLPSAPFSTLRAAFECLFFACALWRELELMDRVQAAHDAERVRQTKAMIASGAASHVAPGRFVELKAIAAETIAKSPSLTAWEAAGAADLVLEYQTIYRGFGIAGAHASLRSLDDYIEEQTAGSFDLGFEPASERTAWLLGLVHTCLSCGTARHREARGQVATTDAGTQ